MDGLSSAPSDRARALSTGLPGEEKGLLPEGARRVAKYLLFRIAVLLLTVMAGLFVAIMAANLGGRVDDVIRAQIVEGVGLSASLNPAMRALPMEERAERLRQMIAAAEQAAGLHEPFLLRSLRWLKRGMTLDLGSSRIASIHPRGTRVNDVRTLILERVPNTLLLLGVTNIAFFLISVSMGLYLSQRYGTLLDKAIVLLSPTSSAPSWFFGLFLVAIFAGSLGWLPFSGMYPAPPPDDRLLYALGVGEHLILPFAAVFLSVFFHSVYVWRTYFLIHAGEDYVDMAKAKGLSPREIGRNYVLKPTLPPILTSFALMVIGVWSGSVILETLFAWPGLGSLFYRALLLFDSGVIVGIIVVYAYFLAVTLLILDIAYAVVDPRVKLGGGQNGQQTGAVVRQKTPWRLPILRPRLPGLHIAAPRLVWPDLVSVLGNTARFLGDAARQMVRYPSAILGLLIILAMIGGVAYAVIAVPYDDAIRLWRAGEQDWQDSPRNARPVWINFFSARKLPESIVLDSRAGQAEKLAVKQGDVTEITLNFEFDFPYDAFARELILYFYTTTGEKLPFVVLNWLTPDGREIEVTQQTPADRERYLFALDARLLRRLGGQQPVEGLFADSASPQPRPLKGTYRLQVIGMFFEEEADLDARFIIHGQVHGLAGTDHRRRDLALGLLWGLPTALAFGLLAAFGASVLTMIVAAFGAWHGGKVDAAIQRVTETNLILPLFPILAMATRFYTLRIWSVLAVAVVFGIFSSALKSYRAIFLQVKEAPYIEAARAYGAGHGRIVLAYLTPRVLPVLVPQMVVLVPFYVFLEAALAFLGLGDPVLPTWGKIINDAHVNSALLNGQYYWMLQPAALLMLTGFAFAMLGFALDRIFNPRLRDG